MTSKTLQIYAKVRSVIKIYNQLFKQTQMVGLLLIKQFNYFKTDERILTGLMSSKYKANYYFEALLILIMESIYYLN